MRPRKPKKVNLKPIGKAIRNAISQLRKAKKAVSVAQRKELDCTIRRLQRREADVKDECRSWWR